MVAGRFARVGTLIWVQAVRTGWYGEKTDGERKVSDVERSSIMSGQCVCLTMMVWEELGSVLAWGGPFGNGGRHVGRGGRTCSRSYIRIT